MSLPKPTVGELALLSVLWTLGPSTVRQVHEELLRERDLGYTTVLKMLQVMTEKGLVVRDESERTHIYAPAQSQAQTQRTLVEDLRERLPGYLVPRLVREVAGECAKTPL